VVLICAVALSLGAQVVEAEDSIIGWLAAALPALGFLVMVKIALGHIGAPDSAHLATGSHGCTVETAATHDGRIVEAGDRSQERRLAAPTEPSSHRAVTASVAAASTPTSMSNGAGSTLSAWDTHGRDEIYERLKGLRSSGASAERTNPGVAADPPMPRAARTRSHRANQSGQLIEAVDDPTTKVPATAVTLRHWAATWVKMCADRDLVLGPINDDGLARRRYQLSARQLRNIRNAAETGALRRRAHELGVPLPDDYTDRPTATANR